MTSESSWFANLFALFKNERKHILLKPATVALTVRPEKLINILLQAPTPANWSFRQTEMVAAEGSMVGEGVVEWGEGVTPGSEVVSWVVAATSHPPKS